MVSNALLFTPYYKSICIWICYQRWLSLPTKFLLTIAINAYIEMNIIDLFPSMEINATKRRLSLPNNMINLF